MGKTVERYVALPYHRVIQPDLDDGGFLGEVLELPGCMSDGKTLAEVWDNLSDAMAGWIEVQLDSGRPVPTPRGDSWLEEHRD